MTGGSLFQTHLLGEVVMTCDCVYQNRHQVEASRRGGFVYQGHRLEPLTYGGFAFQQTRRHLLAQDVSTSADFELSHILHLELGFATVPGKEQHSLQCSSQ